MGEDEEEDDEEEEGYGGEEMMAPFEHIFGPSILGDLYGQLEDDDEDGEYEEMHMEDSDEEEAMRGPRIEEIDSEEEKTLSKKSIDDVDDVADHNKGEEEIPVHTIPPENIKKAEKVSKEKKRPLLRRERKAEKEREEKEREKEKKRKRQAMKKIYSPNSICKGEPLQKSSFRPVNDFLAIKELVGAQNKKIKPAEVVYLYFDVFSQIPEQIRVAESTEPLVLRYGVHSLVESLDRALKDLRWESLRVIRVSLPKLPNNLREFLYQRLGVSVDKSHEFLFLRVCPLKQPLK